MTTLRHPGGRVRTGRRSLLAALVLVPGSPSVVAAAPRGGFGPIRVAQPWARATLPSAPFGVAYADLRNEGRLEDRLVSVETPAAAFVELSAQCGGGGLAGGLPLPPGETVALSPGGLHLMLVGLRGALARGQRVPLTLRFARAEAQIVAMQVEAIGARRPA